jgi:hypothetical protein
MVPSMYYATIPGTNVGALLGTHAQPQDSGMLGSHARLATSVRSIEGTDDGIAIDMDMFAVADDKVQDEDDNMVAV